VTYERLEKTEPAILVGAVTSLGGFLTLLAADFSALHSAAVAFGASGTQALLTRPKVYSPRSIKALETGPDPYGNLPGLLGTGTGFAHPHEPTVTIGVLTLLGSFLVQMFGGVDFVSAFVSAAGIAGVQTTATRARVSSPVSARKALVDGLLLAAPPAGTVEPSEPPPPPVSRTRLGGEPG
jgi:predicted exporter